ncbi:hypothetical protein EXS74_01820 [Candidatus Woesearchaeota archaeon]|nr:hypothetical protein [Candidatus Woesearchaeota archaeon]
MVAEMKAPYRDLIYRIRKMLESSGFRILGPTPEEYGLCTVHRSFSGDTEIVFDYGMPRFLDTSEGRYTIYGGGVREGDVAASFLDAFTLEFDVAVLVSQRNDSLLARGSEEYQCQPSGPRFSVQNTLQIPLF